MKAILILCILLLTGCAGMSSTSSNYRSSGYYRYVEWGEVVRNVPRDSVDRYVCRDGSAPLIRQWSAIFGDVEVQCGVELPGLTY